MGDSTEKRKKRSRKRPCAICGKWFAPLPQVGERQRTCSPGCSKERQRRSQAEWRAKNPGYWEARRLRGQLDRLQEPGSEEKQCLAPRPPPSVLQSIPVEVVQSEFGSEVVVLILFLLRLGCRFVQTEMRSQVSVNKMESRGLLPGPAQSEKDTRRGTG